MSDDIPFDKRFELPPDTVEEVVPGVRRILCNNPSPFTYKGTVSYIIGRGKVAIVDPGPLDDAHAKALLDAVRGETVTHIFVTHTHRDHSPGVPAIKAATGALVLAEGPHRASRALNVGEAPRLDASNDTDFKPDRALADGEVVRGDGFTIEAVTPPAGAKSDYMASLNKLAKRTEPIYLPGHGAMVRDAPNFVQYYIRHRQGREASILHRLAKGETDIPTIVRAVYIGLDPRLIKAAGLSVLAHLEDLTTRGQVVTDGQPSIEGRYRLA
jgi:glyoxylase-like metal-dependent hydrolase (beta-lactamase superfamily II)